MSRLSGLVATARHVEGGLVPDTQFAVDFARVQQTQTRPAGREQTRLHALKSRAANAQWAGGSRRAAVHATPLQAPAATARCRIAGTHAQTGLRRAGHRQQRREGRKWKHRRARVG